MKTLINESNGHQISGNPGRSAYFRGEFKDYGRYAWNIKYYGFASDSEIETALSWAFGERVRQGMKGNFPNKTIMCGFDGISELLGRSIESHIDGRSGGWLVIDTELTEEELTKVDALVRDAMEGLPEFLKNEREFQKQELELVEKHERETLEALQANPTVQHIKALIKEVAGDDAVLILKGMKVI